MDWLTNRTWVNTEIGQEITLREEMQSKTWHKGAELQNKTGNNKTTTQTTTLMKQKYRRSFFPSCGCCITQPIDDVYGFFFLALSWSETYVGFFHSRKKFNLSNLSKYLETERVTIKIYSILSSHFQAFVFTYIWVYFGIGKNEGKSNQCLY